jgi:hypothetical protein
MAEIIELRDAITERMDDGFAWSLVPLARQRSAA